MLQLPHSRFLKYCKDTCSVPQLSMPVEMTPGIMMTGCFASTPSLRACIPTAKESYATACRSFFCFNHLCQPGVLNASLLRSPHSPYLNILRIFDKSCGQDIHQRVEVHGSQIAQVNDIVATCKVQGDQNAEKNAQSKDPGIPVLAVTAWLLLAKVLIELIELRE